MTIECDCSACRSGEPINIQEWRFLNAKHQQIYDDLAAAVERGDIQPQGEANGKDASGVDCPQSA